MIRIIIGLVFLYIVYAVIRLFAIDNANEIPLPYQQAHDAFFEHLEKDAPSLVKRDILCDLFYLQERAKPEQLPIKPILRVGYALFEDTQQLCQDLEERSKNRDNVQALLAWQAKADAFKVKNTQRLIQLQQQYGRSNTEALKVLSEALEGWPDSFYLHHPSPNSIFLLQSIADQKEDRAAEQLAAVIQMALLKKAYTAVTQLSDFTAALYGKRLAPDSPLERMEIRKGIPLLLVQE